MIVLMDDCILSSCFIIYQICFRIFIVNMY
ncbi:hypothetical protein M6B38_263610 [Iris pallida]|uniref:Uncharacterized protein n=1 Tax=Iris pallida TaxID=29817 RepID=A0AAX6IB75_IRIPA|nr:hypothetical protein M6B38_263610 [Iris pallida]